MSKCERIRKKASEKKLLKIRKGYEVYVKDVKMGIHTFLEVSFDYGCDSNGEFTLSEVYINAPFYAHLLYTVTVTQMVKRHGCKMDVTYRLFVVPSEHKENRGAESINLLSTISLDNICEFSEMLVYLQKNIDLADLFEEKGYKFLLLTRTMGIEWCYDQDGDYKCYQVDYESSCI